MRKIWIVAFCMLLLYPVLSPPRVALAVEAAADPAGYLEDQGYVVTDLSEGKFKDTGNSYVMVTMEWESKELWSEDTSTQTSQAFYALRLGFPKAVVLFVDLLYSSQYEIVWRTNADAWDKYQKDKDWNAFIGKVAINVWDKDAGEYLTGSTFVRKNFGAGTPSEPKLPSATKAAAYDSVTVEADKSQVKLKGEVQIRIKVLDKQKEPASKAPVDLSVSGSATGSRTVPKSVVTDEDGVAKATFIGGSKDGAAVITASARGTVGTFIVQVGKGESDPAPTKVRQALQGGGYKVNGVGKSTDDPNSVYVDMAVAGTVADKNGKFDPETVTQVIDGWTALADAYPQATSLVVITRTSAFGVYWTTTAKDFAAYMDSKISEDAFWTKVSSGLKFIDLKTGKPVTSKDFMNKNFQ